jgi:dihydroorotase, multifunctional complex type
MSKVLIKRAKIIDPSKDELFIGDLYIDEGKICEIGEDLFRCAEYADEIIDADGMTLAPGLVDMHVHMRDPGQTKKEDVYTAAKAAAAGGITAMLAMPNTKPAVDTPEVVNYILKRAEKADVKVYTAAAITRGLKGGTRSDWTVLKEAGAIAFSDDGRPVLNTADLLAVLQFAKENEILVTAHCEDLSAAGNGIVHKGAVSEELGIPGIPYAAEDCGTAREIAAAASIDAPIHICHVSTKGSVELIRDAKRRGVKVTAETAPHYLLLTDEMLRKKDADYRMNPPLREEADRLALIEALTDGTIDAIATDHAPHTVSEKADFLLAPNGAIGMETSLSATLTALDGVLTTTQIVRLMSKNPAEILKIPGGDLEIGAPANLVLFDENEIWTVDETKLHGKSRNTPFKGMSLKGKVKYTFYEGRKIFEDKINVKDDEYAV